MKNLTLILAGVGVVLYMTENNISRLAQNQTLQNFAHTAETKFSFIGGKASYTFLVAALVVHMVG